MQSGAWNPIVWIFSMFGRYDLTLFHFENLLYIFLAGLGMYKLTKQWIQHSKTAFLIACSYMLSGFLLSGQLINWLAAAAFIPFVIHYYLLTLKNAGNFNAIKTAIALYFLLTAGYPSFFVMTGYLMMALFIIKLFDQWKQKERSISWRQLLQSHFILILVFIGLALPAFISYIDLLPYYQRGHGASYNETIVNSLEWQHLLTFIFPTSIKASDLSSATDVTLRNCYLGIFAFLIPIVFPPKWSRRNIFLLILVAFSLLFCLGDLTPIRKIFYDWVPLMNTFRHPSQMRLFMILGMLLLAAPGLKQLLEGNLKTDLKKFRLAAIILLSMLIIIVVVAAIRSDIFKSVGPLKQLSSKEFIDNIKMADVILLDGTILILTLAAFLFALKGFRLRRKSFGAIWVLNLIIMAQPVLPATFIGRTHPATINAFIHASPKGFPVSGLEHSLTENSKDILDHFDEIALTSFYNKKIGISRVSNSPAFLDEQDSFLHSEGLYNYVGSKPVVYLADSVLAKEDSAKLTAVSVCSFAITDLPIVVADSCAGSNNAVVSKLSANSFTIATNSVSTSLLVLTQSYHHHWKAWIDGKQTPIYKTNIGFMSVAVSAGSHKVLFRFIPTNTIIATWIMLATLLSLIAAGIVTLRRDLKNHKT